MSILAMLRLLPGLEILEVDGYGTGLGAVVETIAAPNASFPFVGAIMVPFGVELL
jgi:hypothetical protein